VQTLVTWTAQRSGATMTIIGTDADGKDVKVSGVIRIGSGLPHPVAVDQDGGKYELR
jgi:hypothetical protein